MQNQLRALILLVSLILVPIAIHRQDFHFVLPMNNRTSQITIAHRQRQSQPRSVILFLVGGDRAKSRKMHHFLHSTLPLLEANFLQTYPYPVHIFHEGISDKLKLQISTLIPSSPRVTLENVSHIFARTPPGVTEKEIGQWIKLVRTWGRGYRMMCRFWAGLVWTLPSMSKYEYYWRLDSDSYLTKPIRIDPFLELRRRDCQYGFLSTLHDGPKVVYRMWHTYEVWLNQTKAIANSSARDATRNYMNGFALDPHTGEFARLMYDNNFELGTFHLKRHPLYQDMFKFFDGNPPYGFMRYRWGDAPWHTLAVHTVLQGRQLCNFSADFVGYQHAGNATPIHEDKPASLP